MAPLLLALVALALLAPGGSVARDPGLRSGLRLPTWESLQGDGHLQGAAAEGQEGTRWALLIAGSAGYWNYRHQADVCHAYQLLKKDGLKDENIVVFMYDDIAENGENPHRGTIINHPQGSDVYKGVPKDYTGVDVSVSNFLAALLGDASAIQGGSGKVIASGPNDHVFVFYSDHGGPGLLGMPFGPFLFADQIVNTLKKKHEQGGFGELVFYLEACESGSIFQGLLPTDINVYAVTASNAEESSWGTYCPGMDPAPPPEYYTCLGDLFSVAWMEDSDVHNLRKETLKQQYHLVKNRTAGDGRFVFGSHVMRYGDKAIGKEEVEEFLGSDPKNEDAPPPPVGGVFDWAAGPLKWLVDGFSVEGGGGEGLPTPRAVEQRKADLIFFQQKYLKAQDPAEKALALEQYLEISKQRTRLHLQMNAFMSSLANAVPLNKLTIARGRDAPLVDDWDCLRASIRAYEEACGPLTQYGMQFTKVFASLCNALPSAESAVKMASVKARSICGVGQYRGPYSA